MENPRQRISEGAVVFMMILLIYGGISFGDIGSCNEVLDCMGNSTITGNLTVTGNVTATYYFGNGSQLTNIIAAVIDTWVNETGDTITGSIIINENLTVIGNITGNLIYGEMWFHDDTTNGVSTTIDSSGVWYNVTGFASGEGQEAGQSLNGVTYENGNALGVQITGLYKVDYSLSFEKSSGGGVKKEYKTAISVNGTNQNSTETHRSLTSATAVGNTGNSGFLSLSVGDQITLRIEAVDGTDNVGVHSANVNLIRIGD